jgi:hypothetical protein
MRKSMAIIVGLVAWVLPIYGQKEGPQSTTYQSAAYPIHHASAFQVAVWVGPIDQNASVPESENTDTRPQSYLCRLFSPENLPNIGLLIAGIFGIRVAIKTLKVLREQTNATRAAADAAKESADATLKSVELQEVAYRQWVVLDLWKNSTPHIQPTATEAELTLRFEVGNETNFPLTLKRLTTSKETISSTVSNNALITPDDSYLAFFSFDATPAELELYRLNSLIVTIVVEAVIVDVLERECIPQRFTQDITFGPTRCNVADRPRHFQLKIKQTR